MSALIVVSVLLAQAGAAAVEDGAAPDRESTVTALIEQAAQQYDQGWWDEALVTLERAQALSPRPAIIYNMAQVHRMKKDCGAALAAYRRFVAETAAGDPNHERALRWQADMERCIAERASAAPGGDPGPPPFVSATARLPPAPAALAERAAPPPAQRLALSSQPPSAAPAATLIAPQPGPASKPGAGRRAAAVVAAWALVGAGALAGGTALYLTLKAKSIESELSGQRRYDPARNQEGERDARWARWAGLGAGLLAAGGGTALVILYRHPAGGHPAEQGQAAALLGWSGAF